MKKEIQGKNIDTSVYMESFKKHGGNSLAVLLGFYKGKYGNFIISAIFYIIKHSPVWILPIVTANIINYVTEGRSDAVRLIMINAAMLAVLLILNIPANYLHVHFRSKTVRQVEAGLRSTLVHKIQQLSVLYTKDIESGRIQSKIIRDVEGIETLSDQLFVSLLNIIINVVVALSVTVTRSLTVFTFFLLMVPLAAGLVIGFKRPIKKRNQKFRKEMEATSAEVMEMVELVPVTRAHALEGEEIRKMDKRVRNVANDGYALDIIQANFGAVSWVCFQLFQVVCLIFTSLLAAHEKIPAGDVVLYQSYFTNIVGQVSSLLNLLPTIAKGLESVNSIGEILEVPDIEDDTGKEHIEDVKGDFLFENVHFTYPGTENEVIKGLNLHINPGERVAFVGESGAGKSTIVNMVVGFCKPTGGKLLIDGRDIGTINLHDYRSHLAVVPQETILFSGTIKENILYGTTGISDERLADVIKESGLKAVIDKLPDGLDTEVGERGEKLSGGQRQRISIARALIRQPRVMILDEATSALDSLSEKEVTGALDSMSHECTTFIVAHKLATVRNSDLIVVMQDGYPVEMGTYDELMANENGYFHKMREYN